MGFKDYIDNFFTLFTFFIFGRAEGLTLGYLDETLLVITDFAVTIFGIFFLSFD